MSLNEEFTKDPAAFTAVYIVVVGDVTQLDPNKRVDLRDFVFAPDAVAKFVKLRYANKGETDVIKAYWLPWRKDEMVSMDLGSDANFFFTSQMTGCRFSILTNDAKKPKVAHLAGTMSKTNRNKAESEEQEKIGAKGVKARRLSVSGAKDHQYAGLTGKADLDSSAFVYGVRDKDSGNWAFEAQIVNLAITEGFNPKKTANVPEIKKPFKF